MALSFGSAPCRSRASAIITVATRSTAATTTGLIKAYFTVILLFAFFTGCVCDRSRDDIRRHEVVEGGNVTLTCYAQPTKLKAYRWVYIRAGTQRPQVLSSGRRLVVGEPRISLLAKTEGSSVALELTLSDVRPYESGLFMCWRQGQKPDPQVLLTVLEPGTLPEKQVIRYYQGPPQVKYGNSATFLCVITPPWPVKVTWFKNGEAIRPSDRLYTQNVEKTLEPVGDRRIQEEKLVATLTVASIRRDSVFTCRIESDPPDQRDMPVKVLVPSVESLTSDPDKDLVEYGQPLAITCVVSGTDDAVLWLKDGSHLSFGPDTPGREIYSSQEDENRFGSTVYIDSVSFRDNGHYVCYIPGASKNILINIEGRAPRLLGVTGGDFFEDDTLSLRCSAQYMKYVQPGDFRWQFEGRDLDLNIYRVREYHTDFNVTVHELTIPRASEAQAGTYKCLTPYGTASITVDMFIPPSLQEPLPSEVRVREGDTLQLACRAVGSPTPAIQWEKSLGDNWVPVDRTGEVEVGLNGKLRIPAASLGDAGNYRCSAQSEAGSFLADVVVTVVRTGPEVFDIVAPQNVVVGDNFTVQCTVINWDGEVDFTFHEASLTSLDSSRYQVDSYPTEEGMTQVYLTIKDATLADAGRYSCKAGSYASSSTIVEVHDRPAEILSFFSSPAVLDRDIFLTCVVLHGPPKVAFYKDGSSILDHEGSRYSIQSAPSSTDERTHVLKVTAARREDEGIYECAASAVTSASVNVHPKEAKDEVITIEASPAIVGRDFTVTCIVKEWEDEVTFIHNNVVVDSNKDWRYDVSRRPSDEPGEQMEMHTLTVSGVLESDGGTYECYTTPQTFRSTEVKVWDLAKVKLELQVKDRPNWRDSPIPINCIVEGVDPDAVTVLFSHFNVPQVSIQNSTEMSKADHLVNIAITSNDSPLTTSPSNTFTLGFYTLSSDLTGEWSCEVKLPGGHSLGRDTLFLEIEEPPEFAEKIPEEVYVDSDQDLMLNCSTRGSPEVIVSWHSAGIPEPIERRRQSATLFIPGFTAMDVGEYYCSATYLDREIRSKTKLLLRTPKPKVVSVTSSPVVEGQDLIVNCIVSHWTGQVLFLHNSEAVDPALNPRYAARQRSHGRREPNSITHTLLIKDSTPSDNGIVECFISFEENGSTNVTVIAPEEDNGTITLPTITPGRIVELRGQDSFPEGGTLTLTCVVSPSTQEQVILIRDVFLLYMGEIQITQDPRMTIDSKVAPDGSRVISLSISRLTLEDGGQYQCTTSTEPPAQAMKDVTIVPADPDGGVPDCGALTTCSECVTTPLPCRWCLGQHRCVQEVDEECSGDDVVFGQDDGYTQSRSGPNYCPVILKDTPEVLVHNGHGRAIYLDSKNIGEEKTFDNAKFKCSFNMDGREITVKARLWYSYIYCDEVTFVSTSPKVRVPVRVTWGDYNVIDNPDDIHVTVYNCNLLADTCTDCQELHEKYKCGWCKLSNTCEIEGKCPASEWIQPDYSCSADTSSAGEFSLHGLEEMEIFAHPSYEVAIPCTAAVAFDLQAGYWNRKYNIKWTREIDDRVETISENNFLDVSPYDRPRYALSTDPFSESNLATRYDLVINPVQLRDFGLYRCILTNNKNETIMKAVVLSQAEEQISYDRCLLPDHWRGTWYATYDDLTISGNSFGNALCTASLANKYLLRNEEHECNICFVINEKHRNLLEYKESPCSDEEDLNTLCSLVDDYKLTYLKRKEGVTQCPFPSRRVFTYRTPEDECEALPSTIISGKNNTELVFWYQPCTGSEDNYYPSKLECVASWEEDSLSYLMGRLEKIPNRPERYRCFTYKEVRDQEYRFEMSDTGSETCGELGVSFEKSYKIFDAARAPEPPTIEGYSSVIQVTEGYSLQLKCSAVGGFPLATLRWLRNGREVPSDQTKLGDRSEAIVNINVIASDDGAQYTCEATNTATITPLSVTTELRFSRDDCRMPTEWIGRWYEVNNDRYVDITLSTFSNNICTMSLGQTYLLHDKRKNCNRCVGVNEIHGNVLEYRRSKCKPEDDMNKLCSSLGAESYRLIRVGGTIQCPWDGARSFTYDMEEVECTDALSQMNFLENSTQIMMHFSPCSGVADLQHDLETGKTETISCVADWSGEEGQRYFIAQLLDSYDYKQENFRCYIYSNGEGSRELYSVNQRETGLCRQSLYRYKLYGLSEAPSAPVIEGYSPAIGAQTGDVLTLKCVTQGGIPTPTIRWFRNDHEVDLRDYRFRISSSGQRYEASIQFAVAESDEGARFECQVSNQLTNPALKTGFTLSFGSDTQSLLLEPSEIRVTVIPSDKLTLNCTALVSMNIEQYWDLPYKMRWVYYGGGEQRSLSDMGIPEHADPRFSLDIENREEEGETKYNLVIDPIRPSDEGIYECHLWNDVYSFSHQVRLTVGGTPQYEECELPDHWEDDWSDEHYDYEIKNNMIGEKICKKSLGTRYLLRNEVHECNTCFMIEEKHSNLLKVKESQCLREEDLATLCSTIEYGWRWMTRKDATSQCPFGDIPRPFAHAEDDIGDCEMKPNKLSLKGDTQMVFEYGGCYGSALPKDQAGTIDCIATWKEGSIHHLFGKWRNPEDPDRTELRCYTYVKVTDETSNRTYDMSHSGSQFCEPLTKDPTRSYEIYGEAVAPINPIIIGYDPAQRKDVGDLITLTCISGGGYPPPLFRWFREDNEVTSESLIGKGTPQSVLEFQLEDGNVEFRCEVSNMATTERPLVTTITVSSLRGIVKLMKPQVMAVEGQNAFLPCGRILEPDLKLEWYDADLDIQLTSGNTTLGSNDSFSDEPTHSPYITGDLFGLMIRSGFLDTKYSCVVDNQKVGNTTLVILPSLYATWQEYDVSDFFEETETEIEVTYRSSPVLNCTLKPGVDPVTVSWRHLPSSRLLVQDDLSLSEEDGYTIEVIGQSYILSISDAGNSHDGSYICQIILNDQDVYVKNFTLSVQDFVTGNLSLETRLSCYSRFGDTNFLHKGEVLSPSTTVTSKYDWELQEDMYGKVTTLIIKDTDVEDAGVYTCVKSDDDQEIVRKIFLGFASEVMLNVSNLRVLDTKGSEITLGWDRPTEDPFANIELYEVVYFEKGHEDDPISVTTANETYNLFFLDEEVEYGFQVRVKTDMGWGSFTDFVYQKTGKALEVPTITTTITTPTTESSLTTTMTPTIRTTTEQDDFGVEEDKPTEGVPEEKKEEERDQKEEEEKEIDEDDYSYLDYLYEEEEGEIQKVIYEKVVLPCGDFTVAEDMTWKRGEEMLFLGVLDLAGIAGLSLSPKGELILAKGPVKNIRDNDTYTCYVFDQSTFNDVEAASHHVTLNGEEAVVTPVKLEQESDVSKSSDMKFGQVEEIAILANSERVGKKVLEVLQSIRLKVRLLDTPCNATDVRSWASAEAAIKECERTARLNGDFSEEEGVFIGIDFFVELTPGSWFAVTQLYLHNVEKDVSVSVYTPMIPVPVQSIVKPSSPDEPVLIQVTDTWWNNVQGVDKSGGSALTASILSLQESYLDLIKAKSS